MMVSKAELQRKIEAAEIANERLAKDLERAQSERDGLIRDNQAHRARETTRMEREHAEQQAKLREAEREDKRKRSRELAEGMVRLADVSAWSIRNEGDGPVLDLEVPLSAGDERIVHGVLAKKSEPAEEVHIPIDAGRLQDHINRMVAHNAYFTGLHRI